MGLVQKEILMRLYEVGERVREGFNITFRAGHDPAVFMIGKDETFGTPTCITLASGIRRELRHDDDQNEPFRLRWGKYDETTAGLQLLAQTEQESDKDGQALVLIDRCELPNIPLTKIEEAYGHPEPMQLTTSRGDDGHQCELVLFNPGDGLFITWDRRLIGTKTDLRFILWWGMNEKTGAMELQQREPQRRRHYRTVRDQQPQAQ